MDGRWGASVEYVLGALVLGHSLRRSSQVARVCLVAPEVAPESLELLRHIWDCRAVEHVEVAKDLETFGERHRFAKVFTKLRAMELVDFEKVLVMDIDLLV